MNSDEREAEMLKRHIERKEKGKKEAELLAMISTIQSRIEEDEDEIFFYIREICFLEKHKSALKKRRRQLENEVKEIRGEYVPDNYRGE